MSTVTQIDLRAAEHEIERLEARLAETCPDHETCFFCDKPMCRICKVGPPATQCVTCSGSEIHCDDCENDCSGCVQQNAVDHATERFAPVGYRYDRCQ